MRINHNIAALNTYRQFGAANAAQGKSMEKLSSGLRINKAGDDAAGLAISEKMRGQIRGLDQASANAQDGISMISTAEGALSETHSILQRMRELSVQSANDTNTDEDRAAIQDEVNQLKTEIDRIGNTTEFNTQKLLDGSKGATTTSADLTAGVAKEISATNKIAIKDGSETANNKIGFVFSNAAGTDVTELTLKLEEKNYDNVVDFTNAFNSALDAAALELKTQTGKDITADISKVRLAFDVDSTSGDVTFKLSQNTAAAAADTYTIDFDGTDATVAKALGITGDNTLTAATATPLASDAFDAVSKDGAAANMKWNSFNLKVEDGVNPTFNQNNKLAMEFDGLSLDISLTEKTYDGTTGKAATDLAADIKTKIESAIDTAVTALSVTDLKAKGYNGAEADMETAYKADLKNGLTVAFNEDNKLEISSKYEMQIDETSKAASALGLTDVNSDLQEKGVTFQIGANAAQTMTISISDMRTSAIGQTTTKSGDNLKLKDVDVSTKAGAQNAIEVLDTAIKQVSQERSKLGAYSNRLEHTINNLGTSSENLTAAESRIRDVDYALAA